MALVRPSLVLDFTNASGYYPPSMAAFNRGGSAGRYFDRAGILRTAPADAPRFTFDPATGLSLGLLIEPQRTNKLLRSEEFDNASWTKTTTTVTANATAAPDGTTTADRLAATAASAVTTQAVTITAANGIALTVFAKASATPFLRMELTDGTNSVTAWYNLATGVVSSNTAGGGSCIYSNSGIRQLPNGWYRCELMVNTTSNTNFTVKLSPAEYSATAAASGNSVYVWGAQLEEHTIALPTSYIPTTSATVTRLGDQATITAGSWFNSTEGSFVVEAAVVSLLQTAGNAALVTLDDGTSSNRFLAYRNTNGGCTFSVISGGVTQAFPASANNIWQDRSAFHRMALSYRLNAVDAAVDGTLLTPDTSCTMPSGVTTVQFGMTPGGTTPLMGTISRFIYFPRKISNADLTSLTV